MQTSKAQLVHFTYIFKRGLREGEAGSQNGQINTTWDIQEKISKN